MVEGSQVARRGQSAMIGFLSPGRRGKRYIPSPARRSADSSGLATEALRRIILRRSAVAVLRQGKVAYDAWPHLAVACAAMFDLQPTTLPDEVGEIHLVVARWGCPGERTDHFREVGFFMERESLKLFHLRVILQLPLQQDLVPKPGLAIFVLLERIGLPPLVLDIRKRSSVGAFVWNFVAIRRDLCNN